VKYRFRREIFDFDQNGIVEFDWPNDGASGIASARGLYNGDTPCIEVIWRERVEDQ